MTPDVLDLAAGLRRDGEPFVLATVVWRRGPSSARQGAKALILADGTVRGWLGGACAEPTVVRESMSALADGTPRLLFVGPANEYDGLLREGVVAVPMACASEGAMEVYLEPVLPVPQVVAIGRSPAADALARLAAALGWRASVIDQPLDASVHIDERTFVVVATQGHYDEEALESALATPARYVGLIASRKRAAAVLMYLAERGVPGDVLARVHAPAGLDLGSLEPDEIAVAVLGELVSLKAAGALGAVVPAAAAETAIEEVVDPVCGMVVDSRTARYTTTIHGHTYWFCAPSCLRSFEADPSTYAPVR